MTERIGSASGGLRGPKAEADLGPRKTLLVLVIVVGCFAVLWPKVFYPMLVGSASQHIKPGPIDKTSGCCDVISETDVNTIKIMSELCGTIAKPSSDQPLSGREMVQSCRQEVLETCGIDISAVLQEQVRLGQSTREILDQVRSLNGSLCLKYNFGVAPWRLGVPHRVTVKTASDAPNIRQERPHHLRSELIHPAFRERGRAIPQPQHVPPARPPPRVVEGRPGPIPGMRPTLGGAGHVVPPSKQGTSSMSVIMPIYTIGIVIFFTYTLMRIIFKKQPEGVGSSLYSPVEPDQHFRKEVFESEASRLGPRLTRENIASKLVVNAMSALLDEVDQEIEARRKSSELASQDLVNGTLSNGDVVKPQEEQPTVKVLGMEMTASCEGGKKWSRPDSPVLPTPPPPPPVESVSPPQEIYLEGALPAQSHLLVADSATEPETLVGEDPAVVLSGKMTLSVISLDSENGEEIEVDRSNEETNSHQIEEPEIEIEEYVLEPIVMKKFQATPPSKIEIEDIERRLRENSLSAVITEDEESKIEKPLIHLDSEETPHSVQVEELEKEVDELIQKAVESIECKQPNIEILPNFNLKTNEILEKIEGRKEIEPTLQVLPKPEEISSESNLLMEENYVAERVERNNEDEAEETIEPAIKIEETIEEESGDGLKLGAEAVIEAIKEEISKKDVEESSEKVAEKTKVVEESEEKPIAVDPVEVVDDDELGSEEEVVEEIEEIVYESDEESEEEESEEAVAVHKINGERSEDLVEESKYTTVSSGATAAENDISDEELTDNEEADDDEEIIEIEDDEEDYIIEDANHVSDGDSGPEA